MEGVAAERFLIVTRPGSEHVLADKGTDYDAWIGQAAALFPGGRAGHDRIISGLSGQYMKR